MGIVISFVSPKGGCGKSTSCLTLATALAAAGSSVALIDADPNLPLVAWARGASKTTARILGGMTEATLVPTIDAEKSACDFVLVDVEGSASRMASRAIARSDFIIIPAQASGLDAAQAGRAVALIREEEVVLGRSIPHAILLTRTSPAITTRAEKIVLKELRAVGVPVLKIGLHERAAFKAAFIFRLSVHELDPAMVNGTAAAIENSNAFAAEIVATLRQIKQGKRVAA